MLYSLLIGCTDVQLSAKEITACDGELQSDEGTVDGPFDADGDGFFDADNRDCVATWPADRLDCDDGNAAIHPDANDDNCDGVDDDCDGIVDGGATPSNWYADADSDTFGDPNAAISACDQPDGTVADATDCNDADDAVHPGTTDLCNERDDDCDGDIDEDDAGSTWYADADADTYGDINAPINACRQPADAVADASDCNDLDADIHPMAEETCDGVDEDCDDVVDWEIPALHFAESTDSVRLPWASAYSMGHTGTYEVWAWFDAPDGNPLIHQWTSSCEHKILYPTGILVFIRNPLVYFRTSVATDVATGRWTHIAGSFDGTNIRFFRDGVFQSSEAQTGEPGNCSADVYLGHNVPQGSDGAKAWYSDVRISSTGRYTADFTPETSLTTDGDTKALFKLDEGTGTAVGESGGAVPDGVISGAEWGMMPCR